MLAPLDMWRSTLGLFTATWRNGPGGIEAYLNGQLASFSALTLLVVSSGL